MKKAALIALLACASPAFAGGMETATMEPEVIVATTEAASSSGMSVVLLTTLIVVAGALAN